MRCTRLVLLVASAAAMVSGTAGAQGAPKPRWFRLDRRDPVVTVDTGTMRTDSTGVVRVSIRLEYATATSAISQAGDTSIFSLPSPPSAMRNPPSTGRLANVRELAQTHAEWEIDCSRPRYRMMKQTNYDATHRLPVVEPTLIWVEGPGFARDVVLRAFCAWRAQRRP